MRQIWGFTVFWGFSFVSENTAGNCCGFLINKPENRFAEKEGAKMHHVQVYARCK